MYEKKENVYWFTALYNYFYLSMVSFAPSKPKVLRNVSVLHCPFLINSEYGT